MEYALLPFRRYFDFKGRSRRKEYWHFTLLVAAINLVIGVVESVTGMVNSFGSNGPISIIFSLATFIPGLTVLMRRLHDTNRSGLWILAAFAPAVILLVAVGFGALSVGNGGGFAGIGIVGVIAALAFVGLLVTLLAFMFLDGTPGPNRYGADPKQPNGELGDVFA